MANASDSAAPGSGAPGCLGELLLEQGHITQAQLDEAMAVQRKDGGFLGQILVGLKYVDQADVTSCLVKQCRIPHLSLLDYGITPEVLALVPKELCLKYGMLAIDKLGRILTVAMVDPLDTEALQAVKDACPELRIKPILCNWQHFETVSRKLFPEDVTADGTQASVTAASFGLSAAPPPPKPAPPPEAPPPVAPAAPAAPTASTGSAPLDPSVLAAAMQQALAPLSREIRALAESKPADSAPSLADAVREALLPLTAELRKQPPAPAAADTPHLDSAVLADAVRESITGAMQESMASLSARLAAREETSNPESLALAMRDAVAGSMQEMMAEMVVQIRASLGKQESHAGAHDIQAAVGGAVQEAIRSLGENQSAQQDRLAAIAEATLAAVQQGNELTEAAVVAGNTRRGLEGGARKRHESVSAFGGAAAAAADAVLEADAQVRDALVSEKPLESLTFDSFLPGKANAFTFRLSQAVAAAPGQDYNPFFLFGHVGIGKTHLISATGNAILLKHPGLRVGYVSASHFARRLAEAATENAVDAFRDNYCHWDVLILDDIQFLGGRVEAQEEFFHIFNVLHQQQRQIIIASDKAPDRLGLLEQRLISRFASGIVAELKAPEWEARMEILRHLADQADTPAPDEILSLVAMRVPDDVRKMAGALRKALAYAKLTGQELTMEMATDILSHLGAEQAA